MVSMIGYLCIELYGVVWHIMLCSAMHGRMDEFTLPFPSRFEGDYRSWWWATCHLAARGAARMMGDDVSPSFGSLEV